MGCVLALSELYLSVQDSGRRRVESDGPPLQVEPDGVWSGQAQTDGAGSWFGSDADVGDEVTSRAVLSYRCKDVGAAHT